MSRDFELDSAGILAVRNSPEVRSVISAKAAAIRAAVAASTRADVVADDYTTDRAASSVTIRDVRGRLWQARDGVLTRAAAGAGLEVKAR